MGGTPKTRMRMGSQKLGRGLLFGDVRGREGAASLKVMVFQLFSFWGSLSLGMKSKNLILLCLLVFELPGAAGDKSRALEFQNPKKGKT